MIFSHQTLHNTYTARVHLTQTLIDWQCLALDSILTLHADFALEKKIRRRYIALPFVLPDDALLRQRITERSYLCLPASA